MKVSGIVAVLLVGLSRVGASGAQEFPNEEIPNWPAPATWTRDAHHDSRGAATIQTVYYPLPFLAVTPCRIADTRGNGFTGAYGPPSVAANTTRAFGITGHCGIPSGAEAVSFNFTALNVSGAGDLRVFPSGVAAPLASTLNYNANTPSIANAAVIPLGSGGGITVQADATTIDLVIDVNGFYGVPSTGGGNNLFLGYAAGNSTLTGIGNSGLGSGALQFLTSGSNNTAVGIAALGEDADGSGNSALGVQALSINKAGSNNTAVGYSALPQCDAGGNTAVGSLALFNDSSGIHNVAIGASALGNNTSGSENIAIGTSAAINLTAGSNNIHIGNGALSSESGTIRIGTGGTHTKFFVAGVRGVQTVQGDAVPVMIDGLAQLGTLSSSARVKRQIADVGEESSAILKLRPVSFFYRNDTIGIRQYGLIAEEVAEVMPDLVQYSDSGEPETVRYHFLPALLLNEVQKQERTIEDQRAMIEKQNAAIAGLEARLGRLEARLSAEETR